MGIIGVGGELALRRLKKRGSNLDEGFGRIIMLEQDSGIINHSPGNAAAAVGFSTKTQRQDRQYAADADAAGAGSDGWKKKKLPPRLTDFTFSVPSPLTTEITKKTTRARTRTIAAAAAAAREAAAASLLDRPIISSFNNNNRCIVGNGDGNNKAVVHLSPSSKASFTPPHSPHVLFLGGGEESAEVKFSSSSCLALAGGEKEDLSCRHYLLNNKANNKPSHTSSSSASSSMEILSSSRPATTVPSPSAQEVPLRPCIPLSSSKPISIFTPPRPCYNSPLLPLTKFILPAAAVCKLATATQGRRIPICLHTTTDSSIEDTTASPLFSSIDDHPAGPRMDKAREKKRKGEEISSSALSRRKDARPRVVTMKKKMMMMMGKRGPSWPEEELLRMWKESGDDSSPFTSPCPSTSTSTSSTVIAPTTLIRTSERKRPGMLLKKSRLFPTMTGGGSCGCSGWEDDAEVVVDAGGWLEYILIPSPPIHYDGQGQGGVGVGKGIEKSEIPVITSVVALAGLESNEDEGAKRVIGIGNDILAVAGGDGKEEEEEGEGLLVDLFESIAAGGQGGGGGLEDDLDLLASEMKMGESWGWDVISRVEAYD